MSSYQSNSEGLPVGKIAAVVVGVVICLSILLSIGSLFEVNDAGEILVIQSPIKGKLVAKFAPGVYWQGWGKVTSYKKRSQFWFSMKDDQGNKGNESIKVRFNDGGHATISGSISWENPTDEPSMLLLHTKYGSQQSIEQQLVRTNIEKAAYMTGPMMSSKESSSEKRNDLLQYIDDQINNGVYKTEVRKQTIVDILTSQTRVVNVAGIASDSRGIPLRTETSPFKEFNMKTSNLSINSVDYEKTIEDQIQTQQKATMQIQTAVANAKAAEQDAITVEMQGKADAAKSKWAQEIIKAKEVTKAEQEKMVAVTAATKDLEVAKLARQAAEQTKAQLILEGEGESTKRKLIMEADGALAVKAEVVKFCATQYADAIKNCKSNLVPLVQMGPSGTSGNGGGSDQVMGLLNMLNAKTAMEIGMDMRVKQGAVQEAQAK